MKKALSLLIAFVCFAVTGNVYAATNNNSKNGVVEKTGYVIAAYDYYGNKYAVVDFAEFLNTDQVLKRKEVKALAIKQGNLQKENGKYFLYDDYYIYNPTKVLNTFILSNSVDLRMIDYNSSAILKPKKVNYATFKQKINAEYEICKIGIKNNQIVYIYQIYVP